MSSRAAGLLLLAAAGSASAQSFDLRLVSRTLTPPAAPLPSARHVPSLAPAGEGVQFERSITKSRGILVAREIGPDISLGFGLISSKPRRSTLVPDSGLAPSVRGSKKAAVRMTLKF